MSLADPQTSASKDVLEVLSEAWARYAADRSFFATWRAQNAGRYRTHRDRAMDLPEGHTQLFSLHARRRAARLCGARADRPAARHIRLLQHGGADGRFPAERAVRL